MWSKAFSPLLADRLSPAQKFPQLLLSPHPPGALSPERRGSVPHSALDERCVDFALREVPAGAIVELRDSATRRLRAIGFHEPARRRVDVFYRPPRAVSELPVMDEDFFARRIASVWERRQRALCNVRDLHSPWDRTTVYRAANGPGDGLPPLYIDVYSSSFARVVAASAGAARLLPRVAELLRQRGAEELIVCAPFTQAPHLRRGTRVTLSRPTVSSPNSYSNSYSYGNSNSYGSAALFSECGVRGLWLPPGAPAAAAATALSPCGCRWLPTAAHRRARHALRRAAKGKRVLCVWDRGGGAALNAAMAGAARVVLAETDGALRERAREALVANHGAAVFNTCETTDAPLAELRVPPQDIVALEHCPDALATAAQWGAAVRALLRSGACRDGTVIVAMQEAAPLGIAELADNNNKEEEEVGGGGGGRAAGPRELLNAVCEAAGEHDLRVQRLQMFGPSVDYPVLPTDEAMCFSLILRLEKDV